MNFTVLLFVCTNFFLTSICVYRGNFELTIAAAWLHIPCQVQVTGYQAIRWANLFLLVCLCARQYDLSVSGTLHVAMMLTCGPVPYWYVLCSTVYFHLTEVPYLPQVFRTHELTTHAGLCHMVYPGAVHTRFEHSLGTYYLADQAITRIKNFQVRLALVRRGLQYSHMFLRMPKFHESKFLSF